MTKKICDICGNDIPAEMDLRTDDKLCISFHGKMWDVCSECRRELYKWMTKRKAESEVNA